ncbi:MAG: hypothetical protein V2G42_00355 [bacterium JZ-2024 1]
MSLFLNRSFAALLLMALPALQFPFLGPGKPIKGFGYALTPGLYSEYRVTIRAGEKTTSHTYRITLLREYREKGKPILTLEHAEQFPDEPQTVAQFDVGKREWEFYVGNPGKYPLAPVKIVLQKDAEPQTIIQAQPSLSVYGRKLGLGFHFLGNFSIAVKDVKPAEVEPQSYGVPPRKVSSYLYSLNYATEDFYEGELPQRVHAKISGLMFASDEVPFGIVRLEVTKKITRTFEVVGVKAPPESVTIWIGLSLERVGNDGRTRLVEPATESPRTPSPEGREGSPRKNR